MALKLDIFARPMIEWTILRSFKDSCFFYEKENTYIYLSLFLCRFTCYDYWRFDINDNLICAAS